MLSFLQVIIMKLKLLIQAVLKFILGIVLLGVLIFLPAGTLAFFGGWLLMGILFVPMLVAGIVMIFKSPALLEKRLNAKEKQAEQSLVVKLSGLMFLAGFIVAGLDFRFGWTKISMLVRVLASAFFLLSYLLYAEVMLDSVCSLLDLDGSPVYMHLDYKPIIDHYLKKKDQHKVELYVRLMLQEQQAFKEKRQNFNLVETIVDLQTEQKRQELRIAQLGQANHRLWLLICMTMSAVAISIVVAMLMRQKKQHRKLMRQADEELTSLVEKLDRTNAEKEMRAEEIKEFLKDKDNSQELETMIPTILQTDGESKFRQYFELLYPLFIPRLRDKVPSITYREELLSMLIVLKQSNKRISELLAIAPRSVLMLRHRFRQKIGMTTENSLENFIEEILNSNNLTTAAPEAEPESLDETTQM